MSDTHTKIRFTDAETDAMQRARRLVLRLLQVQKTDNRRVHREVGQLNAIDLQLLNEAMPLINSALTKMEDLTEVEQHFNQVRVKDLQESTRSFLYCGECCERYSANRGDYFALDPEQVLLCCGQPMWLATEKSEIVPTAEVSHV